MRFITALLAFIPFALTPLPSLAAQHQTCTSYKAALEHLKEQAPVTASIKLTKAQSALVVADYNRETGQGVEADQLSVVKVKSADGEERVGVAFTKDGCMIGISVVNPSHLAELLGRAA